MDYASLIRDAWSMTWRYRWLWIIGLFAGSSGGSCSNPGFNAPFQYQLGSRGGPTFEGGTVETFTSWIMANLGLIIAVLVLIIVLVLILLTITIIAKGSMVQATVDLAEGRPSSLGSAVRGGLHLFWRFLGLSLIIFALWLLVILTVAALFIMGALIFSVVGTGPRIALVIAGVLLSVVVFLVLIPVSIVLGIIVAWAQRAIVVENVGPLAALEAGYALLRRRLGPSLLIWLISVGIGIAVGLVFFVLLMVVAIPLTILGIIFYMAAGFGALTIAYIVLAVFLTILVMWLLGAVVNTYFWSYWTLGYVRLRGMA